MEVVVRRVVQVSAAVKERRVKRRVKGGILGRKRIFRGIMGFDQEEVESCLSVGMQCTLWLGVES